MFFIKKIYCRAFQLGFRAALPLLPYREPKIISSVTELGEVFKKEILASALIVTDRGIVKSGLVEPLTDELRKNGIGYAVFDGTRGNPTVENVHAALEMYRNNGCNALIAIGGGSAMDCAKAVGAMAVYPGKRLDQLGGILKVHRKLPTLIAIPTTAGTGSETTVAALVTDEETHKKYAIMSFPLIPDYAVLDARLTYSLPPHLTATTGIDALAHAVEAYIGRSTTKETRRLAVDAAKLVFQNIERAYKNGRDHEARDNMLHAAYKAGIAFSKSYVGYIHAVAHTLGGEYNTPHGLANAVIMPYFLEAYGKSVHKKLHKLGTELGICSANDTHEVGAKKFISAVNELNSGLGIPKKLVEIKESDIPKLAKRAEKEANPLYPVPKLMTAKELCDIYYLIGEINEKN